MAKKVKDRAPRNRTIEIASSEAASLRTKLNRAPFRAANIENSVVLGDAFDILKKLPPAGVDLLFADPPYNLTKSFGKESFKERSSDE